MASYAYDALGRRIERVDEKASATLRFYYTGQRIIEDTDGSDTVQRHYVWGNYIDELLLMRDVAGVGGTANQDLVVLRDERFSPTALVKRSDGSIVERYEHDAFGKMNFLNADFTAKGTQQSAFGLRYAYTGRELDILDSGNFTIMNFRGRYYDPAAGTFYQRDPIGYPDGMNAYAGYFAMWVGLDPTGLDTGMPFGNFYARVSQMPHTPPTRNELMYAQAMAVVRENSTPRAISNMLGGAVRDTTQGWACSLDNAGSDTQNPWVAGGAGALANTLRLGGNVGGSVADPIGTVDGVINDVKHSIDVGQKFGFRMGIGEFIGLNQAVEAGYKVDLETGCPLDDNEAEQRLQEACFRFSATSGGLAWGLNRLGVGNGLTLGTGAAAETEATVFRQGTFANKAPGWKGNYVKGPQWATDNPLTTPNYAQKYGLPGENTAKPDWVVGGRVQDPYTTRPAPPSHNNPLNTGGAPEILPGNPSNVRLDWFYMTD